MHGQEFIALAGKLVGWGRAGARSAVSRAYYGAFHEAQTLLMDLAAERCGSGKAHVLVPQYLASAGDPDGQAAARLLADLHAERIKADYRLDDGQAESREFAMICVETAERVRRLLIAIRAAAGRGSPLESQLRAGIARVKAMHRL